MVEEENIQANSMSIGNGGQNENGKRNLKSKVKNRDGKNFGNKRVEKGR